MIPLDEAQQRDPRRGRAARRRVESRSRDALGLVLAADVDRVRAGAAVRQHRDGRLRGARRRHRGRVRATRRCGCASSASSPAGHAPTVAVGAGEAIRIMTGAPMPDGADAIVMVERTRTRRRRRRRDRRSAARRRAITCAAPAATSRPGERRVRRGHRARARAPRRAREPRRRRGVGVIRGRVSACCSTGDELVERARSRPGKIRDSNRPMLLALLDEAGCEAVDFGIARDDEADDDRDASRDAVDACDALVTSGAVSVGDYDFVKRRARAHRRRRPRRRARRRGTQVAIKPAKPLCVRRCSAACRCSGCPGNPVSSRVSFELFARPALRDDDGPRPTPFRPEVAATRRARVAAPAPTASSTSTASRRRASTALRVRAAGSRRATCSSGMAAANGLALLPDGDGVEAGDPVTVMLL